MNISDRITVVESLPQLGMQTAVEFVNWIADNPHGVISLPTGRTPEYFIKALGHILADYSSARKTMPQLRSPVKPVTSDLKFFQMDEFLPFRATDRSFKKFIHRFYVPMLGLKQENIHTIDFDAIVGRPVLEIFPHGQVDLSLRMHRYPGSPHNSQQQVEAIARIDAFCDEYEKKIADLGGLGFVLLGVGPDGHVAFNCFGTSPYSVTRFTDLNYPTKAAAAGDLGGIQTDCKLFAITIGLQTLLNAKRILVFAAGEAKADIIYQSLHVANTPLSCIFIGASDKCHLFLTEGAAKRLQPVSETRLSVDRCKEKVLKGLELLDKSACTFIHTEPHHDDILLGYYPLLLAWLRPCNTHHVLSLTAGFNSVADRWLTTTNGAASVVELKSEIRKQEGQAFWKSLGVDISAFVQDLNLPFYTADIFAPELKHATDVLPIAASISAILDADESGREVLLTVLTDPESSGPDTHFKCLLAVAQAAVDIEHKYGAHVNFKILCYRNVWTSFDLQEMHALIPVPLWQWEAMRTAFLSFYKTQAAAEFPSAEYDGDFASFAKRKGEELGQRVRSLLGDDFFDLSDDIRLRAATGFIGVQLCTVKELETIAGDRLKNFK